jgi:hypothetical protein
MYVRTYLRELSLTAEPVLAILSYKLSRFGHGGKPQYSKHLCEVLHMGKHIYDHLRSFIRVLSVVLLTFFKFLAACENQSASDAGPLG